MRASGSMCVLQCGGLALAAVLCVTGCANKVRVLPVFNTYKRVIIDTSKNKTDQALISSLWMREFPNQKIMDWNLAKAQLGVSAFDTPADVQRANREINVKGIVYINDETDTDQVSIYVVDTESTEHSASVFLQGGNSDNPRSQRRALLERAIRMLANAAQRAQSSP